MPRLGQNLGESRKWRILVKILVVDDSATARNIIIRLLAGRADLKVLQASGGREALALLKAEKPDLVITDIYMDDLNGEMVIQLVRRLNAKTPIIVLSIETDKEYLGRLGKLGANAFLRKPVSQAELLAALTPYLPPADANG